jgi:hypothetical protein
MINAYGIRLGGSNGEGDIGPRAMIRTRNKARRNWRPLLVLDGLLFLPKIDL